MKILVVSHPAVLRVNQQVYVDLMARGNHVDLVVPTKWQHDYVDEAVPAEVHPALDGRVHPVAVHLGGKPLRHFYRARPSRLLRTLRPDVAFLEQEAFSLVAGQWTLALRKARVPFGIQNDENLDRPLPAPLRWIRSSVLGSTAFVAARSEQAQKQIERWADPAPHVRVVPHPVIPWSVQGASSPVGASHFTVGYAGRLIEEKGVRDLLAACAGLSDVRLLLVGSGPLEDELAAAASTQAVEVRPPAAHDAMPGVYAEMDVLVLPSRTTATWAEQFGRVLVEALWCGTPVVGSSSGEIPWVIGETGGGVVFPEGDVHALRQVLADLRDDPGARERLAARGRESVARRFTTPAVAAQLDELLRGALR